MQQERFNFSDGLDDRILGIHVISFWMLHVWFTKAVLDWKVVGGVFWVVEFN